MTTYYTEDDTRVRCLFCHNEQPVGQFRKFNDKPFQIYDFCVTCEKATGGLYPLYAKYSEEWTTPGIVEHISKRVENVSGSAYTKPRVPNAITKKENKELARREMMRRRLVYYTQQIMPSYQAGWVHHDICRRLEQFMQDVEAKRSPRLMLCLPPRTGKSLLASGTFIEWVFGHHPEWEFIHAANASSLAERFSRDIRDRINSPEYKVIFPETQLKQDSQSVQSWMTSVKGGYLAAGVGTGIVGRGAHILVIDDPIKDDEAADSETIRENIYSWYMTAARTRLAPGGGVLICNCLVGDTNITMADGGYKPIRDIRPGDMVQAWDNGLRVTRKVLNWTSQPVDKILELRTGSSRVRGNARHPFLVQNDDGTTTWVPMGWLQKGDKIVTSAVDGFGAKATLTETEAWLLGFMFGDGWITVRNGKNYDKKRDTYYRRTGYVTCVATKKSVAKNAKVLAAFSEIFGVIPKQTKFGYRRMEVASVGKWFLEKGLAGRAKTKQLPEFMFSEPLHIRLAFMRGIIDSDGHIPTYGPNEGRRVLGLSNKKLVIQLRHLARSCGFRVTNVAYQSHMVQAPHSKAPIYSETFSVSWLPTPYADSFCLSTVRTVEPVEDEVVYDIQVEGAESFFADGMVSHNTRWHDCDLSGRLLQIEKQLTDEGVEENQIERWDVVNYPAIAEADEYLMPNGKIELDPPEETREGARLLRHKGEALHPERYSVEALMRIKLPLMQRNPRHWHALYQQKPVPDEGAFFQKSMFRYEPVLPDHSDMTIVSAWDLAIGEKRQNDYTVGIVGAIDSTDTIHIIDVIRARMMSLDIVDAILDIHNRYRPTMIGIEHGMLSMSIMPMIKKRAAERHLYPNFDETLKPVLDKQTRAGPLRGRMQAGAIVLPQNQPWVEKLVAEFLRFPNGEHDDIVDAAAYLVRMCANIGPPLKKQPKKHKGWRDKLPSLISPTKNWLTA